MDLRSIPRRHGPYLVLELTLALILLVCLGAWWRSSGARQELQPEALAPREIKAATVVPFERRGAKEDAGDSRAPAATARAGNETVPGLALPPPTPASPSADPSAAFFAAMPCVHLEIELDAAAIAALEREERRYVRSTVREGSAVYRDVGIHLKGAAGSYRPLDDRPALSLNFDKFTPGQRFHGLDKLHLNNSVQDPSYLNELICGELFLAARVPAARTAHARVKLNGRDLGIYVLKEGFDRSFLRRHFRSPDGNLYDGGFVQDVSDDLRIISGPEPEDRSDLERLRRALDVAEAERRFEAIAAVVDVERFFAFAALEVMTCHWDGYTRNRNNYRVYRDPDSDRLVFMPHGMDQMFGDADAEVLPASQGLVAQALLGTPTGRKRYLEVFRALFEKHFHPEAIAARLRRLRQRLEPEFARLGDGDARAFVAEVQALIQRIDQRAESLKDLLSAPPPEPLRFDDEGRATLAGGAWRPKVQTGEPRFARGAAADGVEALEISAGRGGSCIGSFRLPVLLEPGRYRFDGRLCSDSVVGLSDRKGAAAGLRISGSSDPRPNRLAGSSGWKTLSYSFQVEGPLEQVVLVCELRATQGRVWFDLESLKLSRLPR